jgi:hypothetical protein
LIRHKIIDCFRGTDFEAGPEEVAKRLGLDKSALLSLLHTEMPLDDLAGLTINEAKRVLKQFEGMAVFAPDLEKVISEFDGTRDQIREIEKLAGERGE